MSRAERKRAQAAALKGPVLDGFALIARLKAAKLPGTPKGLAERARKAIVAYAEHAAAQRMGFADLVVRLVDGRAAATIHQVEAQQARASGRDPTEGAACRAGCAFCCILPGADGGTITAHEAARLHAALVPLTGQPDGRAWHKRACPALDPESRMCRAYDARPALCRSFHSTDAAACEANAAGAQVEGPRLEGAHLSYLAAHGLARAALRGTAAVPTFSLFETARGAVEGRSVEETLDQARHGDGELDAERRRTGKALRAARRR